MPNCVNVNAESVVTKSTINIFSLKKCLDTAKRSGLSVTSDRKSLEGLNTEWWLTFYPLGDNKVSVYIHVSKPVMNVNGTIDIEYNKTTIEIDELDDNCCIIENATISNNYTVWCTVEFEVILEPIKVSKFYELADNSKHYLPDFKIVVGESTLKVHQHFLRMISPVFNAYFTNNSKESQTGIVKIDDFPFQTVKNAIDYSHGREIPNLSIEDTIDILRFADKYDVKSITTAFEQVLFRRLSYANFNPVAAYAWKFTRKELKKRCCEYYKKNSSKLIFNEAFFGLPMTVRDKIMRSALPPKDPEATTA